ncbi:MAG: hypothetical protein H6741_34850 [Alphaproteobacteria bacterium]|nr:hypothetical protein [Alphaproteobacteria bacterium]
MPLPERLQADAERRMGRVRRVLWTLVGVWGLHLVMSLLLDAQVEGGPPMWLARGALVGVAAFTALGAWSLRAGSKRGWGMTVSAAAVNLLHPLLFIPAFWVVWQLFKPSVMGACLGGVFAQRLDGGGGERAV